MHFCLAIGVINSESFFPRLFGNTIWLVAIFYYIYITFLGYNCELLTLSLAILKMTYDTPNTLCIHSSGIPFTKNSRIILAPIPLVALFYLITLIIGWNITITFVNFYRFYLLL